MEAASEEKVKPIKMCPECGSEKLVRDYDSREVICHGCGLVVSEKEDFDKRSPRMFDAEDVKKKSTRGSGENLAVHDKGLSTVIDWRNKSITGRNIGKTDRQRIDFANMRRWQKKIRVSDAAEKNLAKALTNLRKLASDLNISRPLVNDGANVYRRYMKVRRSKGKKSLGRNIMEMMGAVVYYECRLYGVPRRIKEIAAACDSGKKQIYAAYCDLTEELGLQLPAEGQKPYVSKICNKLEASGIPNMTEVEVLSIKTLEIAKKYGLVEGKTPPGISMAIIYIASNMLDRNITQEKITEIAHMTEVTIRNRCKALAQSSDFVEGLYILAEQEGIDKRQVFKALGRYASSLPSAT